MLKKAGLIALGLSAAVLMVGVAQAATTKLTVYTNKYNYSCQYMGSSCQAGPALFFSGAGKIPPATFTVQSGSGKSTTFFLEQMC